ncbi:MAG: DNA polymerase III subunit delta', partial [Pseudomonadota bacterium]
GQDTAVDAFTAAWQSGRMHHAWLLRGPEGVGKATLAYRVARAILVQPQAAGGLFGAPEPGHLDLETPTDCPVQARITAQSEPRLHVLRRGLNDQGRLQNQITVDRVRAVRQFLTLSAADGGWRVIIVDSADEMNRNAANALLKFLEEPPAETLFLLISHSPAGLLPTIRSRCRTVDLHPLDAESLAWALAQAGAGITRTDTPALAELGAGSAGRALRLIAGDGVAVYMRLLQMLRAGRGVDRAAMTELADMVSQRDAATRYSTVISLTQTLLTRLARRAAMAGSPDPVAPEEDALWKAAASHPGQAGPWAEVLSTISRTTAHAMAVNLDPGQCVIDTFLRIDDTLSRVRTVAA